MHLLALSGFVEMSGVHFKTAAHVALCQRDPRKARNAHVVIIRGIERDVARRDAIIYAARGGESFAAGETLLELEDLAAGDEFLGSDLFDAIEKWEQAADAERERNVTIRRGRMLEAARPELDANLAR